MHQMFANRTKPIDYEQILFVINYTGEDVNGILKESKRSNKAKLKEITVTERMLVYAM